MSRLTYNKPNGAGCGSEHRCDMLGCTVLMRAAHVLKLYIAGGRADDGRG